MLTQFNIPQQYWLCEGSQDVFLLFLFHGIIGETLVFLFYKYGERILL